MKCHSAAYRQTGILSPKHVRYRGVALVWAAILLMLMILVIGLSLDTAKIAYNLHELQNAADAAALAGAQIVKVEPADVTRLWTQYLGLANKAEHLVVTLRTETEETVQPDPFPYPTDWDDPGQVTAYEAAMAPLDIILGRWINNQRYFFPTLDTPDAVKVIARRATGLTDAPALAMLFGPLVGVYDANAIRVAVGWDSEISGAGLIVLDPNPDELGLYVLGTGDIRVFGGSIHVNSTATGTKDNPQTPAAVYVQGEGKMLCGRLTVTGTTDPYSDQPGLWENIWTDDDAGIEMPYDIFEGAPYMPDPLRNIPPPDYHDYPVLSYDETSDGSVTLSEGYYPDGIEITTTGTTVTLNPGTYILGGGHLNKDSGLIMTGGNLIGHGVLIYLTKDYVDPDGRWAWLNLGGSDTIDIFPPGDLMDPKEINGLSGISIWQDRANTENTASLRGGADMLINGTLYFPNNLIDLAGQPGKAGNQIICWRAQVAGTAPIIVEYDGRNNLSDSKPVLVQ